MTVGRGAADLNDHGGRLISHLALRRDQEGLEVV
jgi:hypothetical protein